MQSALTAVGALCAGGRFFFTFNFKFSGAMTIAALPAQAWMQELPNNTEELNAIFARKGLLTLVGVLCSFLLQLYIVPPCPRSAYPHLALR